MRKEDRILEIIEEYADQEVFNNYYLKEDLGLGSLEKIELITDLELEFNKTVPDDVIEDIETVQDVIDLIGEYL